MRLCGVLFALWFVGGVLGQYTVHLVPHSHDDVGWLKTVDQYYVGSNSSIQNAGVQFILDTVIRSLLEDPSRTFIYVEIAFFIRWWREQSASMQQTVKQLIQQGRLEFINGGWCMNDEATTYYSSIIDQMTEGHLFLKREFGVVPTIGWHIDPFGHSSTQARLFAEMAFDAFIVGRIDYQDRSNRKKNKEMEMIWRPSPSLGSASDIFTSVLYQDYSPPPGFCLDCGDDPIQDDPRLFDMNVVQKVNGFVAWVKQQAMAYKSSEILLTMGMDFNYMNAEMNFKNMDKLMRYVNSRSKEFNMTLVYSTPSRYVKAVNQQGFKWSIKTDDFFPYADYPHAYWTGYFTSRAALKQYERFCSNIFQSVNQLSASYALSSPTTKSMRRQLMDSVVAFSDAMGVAQHHDAVSGTEKQHVAFDYAKRLSIGMYEAYGVMNNTFGRLLSSSSSSFSSAVGLPSYAPCPLLNISICPIFDSLPPVVAITLYNPTGQLRNEFIRLPNKFQISSVLNPTGASIPFQYGHSVSGSSSPFFEASLPPLSIATYFVVKSSKTEDDKWTAASMENNFPQKTSQSSKNTQQGYVMSNSFVSVSFDVNGRPTQITDRSTNQVTSFGTDLLYYVSSKGTSQDGQASGAYIFRPVSDTPTEYPIGSIGFVNIGGSGQLVQEIGVNYVVGSTKSKEKIQVVAQQVYRLFANSRQLEIETLLNPIDISDNEGKEVVLRFSTNLTTNGLLYTDSNGLEALQRRRRDSSIIQETVAGNYFPVNSFGFIRDSNPTGRQLTVITDRSQGGGSIADGQLELMINRRTVVDDSRGVGEPLNESIPIITRHYVIFGRVSDSASSYRPLSQQMNKPLVPLFSTSAASFSEWKSKWQTSWSPKLGSWPAALELLTFRIIDDNLLLLRLHHLYAIDESNSASIQVDIAALFPFLKIQSIEETTLTANKPKSEASRSRMQWKVDDETDLDKNVQKYVISSGSVVTLNAMEIKTFLVTFAEIGNFRVQLN